MISIVTTMITIMTTSNNYQVLRTPTSNDYQVLRTATTTKCLGHHKQQKQPKTNNNK